jgi:hypothetical protein
VLLSGQLRLSPRTAEYSRQHVRLCILDVKGEAMGKQREELVRTLLKVQKALDANARVMTELKDYFLGRAEEEKAIQKRDEEKLKKHV